MADIPTLADLESSLVLAERVELLVSTDKLTTMKRLELDIISPETRFNHGTKRTYAHSSPDIGLRFTLYVTAGVIDYLRLRALKSSVSNVLPSHAWGMKITDIGGVSKTITVNGKLTERRYVKEDGEQGSPVNVECLVRITDEFDSVAR